MDAVWTNNTKEIKYKVSWYGGGRIEDVIILRDNSPEGHNSCQS